MTKQFTQTNTEGFSDDELAAMNDEFNHALQIQMCNLPDGAEGADYDLIAQITKTTAEAVLRDHGAA